MALSIVHVPVICTFISEFTFINLKILVAYTLKAYRFFIHVFMILQSEIVTVKLVIY